MRSIRRLETSKRIYRHKVNKRRFKSTNTLGCTTSILDFENINEVIRVHKGQRAEGKGAWKVVPKDSCEVYRDRQKRQNENNRRDSDYSRATNSDCSSSRSRRNQKRNDGKRCKKEAVSKKRKGRNPKRRWSRDSSVSSFITTTTMSSSEMDYD